VKDSKLAAADAANDPTFIARAPYKRAARTRHDATLQCAQLKRLIDHLERKDTSRAADTLPNHDR
jgi:hypothetical protein